MTTAGESPFSNGTIERHNLVVSESMKKTIQDVKCLSEIALAWAISAQKSLQNHGGFGPNQLVFGHNINLPSVLTDALPALENSTSSDIIRKNMKAKRKAGESYIQAESSERLRRALRHNVRTYADGRYCNGDKVCYRRKNFKGWKGLGVVLGQDGQYVLIRDGGAYYRVHPRQLMKIHDARKLYSLDTNTKATSSPCMSGGGNSDCVNIGFSNQSINQIDLGNNEDGILMFERTEDDVDEESNNKDGNEAQSENDLNKRVDNEDGVLSAEDTGNAEGTIVNEDRAEDTGNAEGYCQ